MALRRAPAQSSPSASDPTAAPARAHRRVLFSSQPITEADAVSALPVNAKFASMRPCATPAPLFAATVQYTGDTRLSPSGNRGPIFWQLGLTFEAARDRLLSAAAPRPPLPPPVATDPVPAQPPRPASPGVDMVSDDGERTTRVPKRGRPPSSGDARGTSPPASAGRSAPPASGASPGNLHAAAAAATHTPSVPAAPAPPLAGRTIGHDIASPAAASAAGLAAAAAAAALDTGTSPDPPAAMEEAG